MFYRSAKVSEEPQALGKPDRGLGGLALVVQDEFRKLQTLSRVALVLRLRLGRRRCTDLDGSHHLDHLDRAGWCDIRSLGSEVAEHRTTLEAAARRIPIGMAVLDSAWSPLPRAEGLRRSAIESGTASLDRHMCDAMRNAVCVGRVRRRRLEQPVVRLGAAGPSRPSNRAADG